MLLPGMAIWPLLQPAAGAAAVRAAAAAVRAAAAAVRAAAAAVVGIE